MSRRRRPGVNADSPNSATSDTGSGITSADGTLTSEHTLSQGDLLYIPRGWAHDVHPDDEDSLHVTVGVMPNTFVDLFLGVAGTAVKDPAFRRSLPAAGTLSYDEAYKLADQFKGKMKAVIDGFDPMELVSQLRH